jgi:hypothetical protein
MAPKEPKKPIYQRRWFWPAVGGIFVLGAVGSQLPSPPPNPEPTKGSESEDTKSAVNSSETEKRETVSKAETAGQAILGENSQPVQKALAALKSEAKIVDILFDPSVPVQWHIGVITNGTSRIGYANYVCEVLKESGASQADTIVRIVDIAKMREGVGMRDANLGAVKCSDRSVFQRPILE